MFEVHHQVHIISRPSLLAVDINTKVRRLRLHDPVAARLAVQIVNVLTSAFIQPQIIVDTQCVVAVVVFEAVVEYDADLAAEFLDDRGEARGEAVCLVDLAASCLCWIILGTEDKKEERKGLADGQQEWGAYRRVGLTETERHW